MEEPWFRKINDLITLKAESNRVNIYIDNKLFNQCTFLHLNVSTKDCKQDLIDSIDEAEQFFGDYSENNEDYLSLRERLIGHASNLQVWVESGYDSRLLHRNIAFPMLKKLVDAGDKKARQIFNEEIVSRYTSNFEPVVTYLINEGYLNYLSIQELEFLIKEKKLDINYKIPILRRMIIIDRNSVPLYKEWFNSIYYYSTLDTNIQNLGRDFINLPIIIDKLSKINFKSFEQLLKYLYWNMSKENTLPHISKNEKIEYLRSLICRKVDKFQKYLPHLNNILIPKEQEKTFILLKCESQHDFIIGALIDVDIIKDKLFEYQKEFSEYQGDASSFCYDDYTPIFIVFRKDLLEIFHSFYFSDSYKTFKILQYDEYTFLKQIDTLLVKGRKLYVNSYSFYWSAVLDDTKFRFNTLPIPFSEISDLLKKPII